ncbi:MAG: LacI family DNA-binding transcriptional regulator [Succinivibrio sp.]|nr:LacI family DNA-binding transcriptional regulator [Succinivibrio sp.]
MANITEIAKELGIAPSTVSRALKKPELVSLDTRHKVLQMAEKLGYLQKLRDDATAATATNLIGVIVADLTNSFSNQIVKAVHDTLENSGYSAIVGCNYEQSSIENRLLKQWASLNLKGLIIMPTARFSKTINSVEANYPIVLVDRNSEDLSFDSVIEDNRYGASQAIDHLRELGHDRIVFITGARRVYTFNERCLGVESTNQASTNSSSVQIEEIDAESYDELFIGAFEKTNILMMKNKALRPTAIVGANNAITAGILYALNLKDFKLPTDVSVVSYGDSDWCRFYPTPITSMCQPVDEMGREAASILLERIKGKQGDPEKICLKSMLLRRASSSEIQM